MIYHSFGFRYFRVSILSGQTLITGRCLRGMNLFVDAGLCGFYGSVFVVWGVSCMVGFQV